MGVVHITARDCQDEVPVEIIALHQAMTALEIITGVLKNTIRNLEKAEQK